MRLAEVSEVRYSSGARECRWILLGPWLPRFPDFWLVPPAFVTVVGYFGLQNVGEVYGLRRTYGCVLRLAM